MLDGLMRMLFESCFVTSFLQHALCFGALRLIRQVLNDVYVFPHLV